MSLITNIKQIRTTITVAVKKVQVNKDINGGFALGKKPNTMPSVWRTVVIKDKYWEESLKKIKIELTIFQNKKATSKLISSIIKTSPLQFKVLPLYYTRTHSQILHVHGRRVLLNSLMAIASVCSSLIQDYYFLKTHFLAELTIKSCNCPSGLR